MVIGYATVSGNKFHAPYQTHSSEGRPQYFVNIDHQSPIRTTVRVINKKGKDNVMKPRYLEAMALLMAKGLSVSEAIRAVCIIDRVVWNHVHHLPLRLDKSYMNAYTKLKKNCIPKMFIAKLIVLNRRYRLRMIT